jgi:beta-xylosidase
VRIRWIIVVAATVTWLGAAAPAEATPAQAVSTAPAYPGDFPDPFIVPVATPVGTTYWAYSTGSGDRNLQVMSSTSLDFTNGRPADPLPRLPWWAQAGKTWAPSVLHLGNTFVMYYTVHAFFGPQCISVATSSNPAGPFTDHSLLPLVCQLDHGGSIDPSPLVAPDGKLYLLWKSDDNAIGQKTNLWAQPLTANGRSLMNNRSLLLTADEPWQGQPPLIEGPSMFFANHTYYLFYGANNWGTPTAGIGYATCSTPLGPCTEKSLAAPWLGSRPPQDQGPAGPSLFVDATGHARIAYHAWTGGVGYNTPGAVRSLWLDSVTFTSSGPVLG